MNLLIKRYRKILISTLFITVLMWGGSGVLTPAYASDNSGIGMPEFKGSGNPVPDEPAPYTEDNMMMQIYNKEKDGTDFWMDRLLARKGEDPAGDWLWTRGRALFMKTHDPSVIGFGGHVAYWGSINDKDAYSIKVGSGDLDEDVSQRKQTPSYWKGTYNNDQGISVVVKKYITHQNVAVTNLAITNNNDEKKTLQVTAESPYTKKADGDELAGTVKAKNDLTTIYPRLSGDDLTADGKKLKGSIDVDAGKTIKTKVQMGFVTKEISQSTEEYHNYQDFSPQKAFATHVQKYNKWWANNVPYIDVPNDNIKKNIYYRWWLLRYNYLDANMPGHYYQFPTSVEGALGYNNAIDLTVGMFQQDLKYLRNPVYSYGPWTAAGEAMADRYRDNPGDPANWSTSHAQYLSEAAWGSYKVHGGPNAIVKNFANYASRDVRGQLDAMDSNNNGLLETGSNAWAGNDADTVSFDYYGRTNERTESAYVYGNAQAASEAYEQLGKDKKANEMKDVADKVQNGILNLLWDDDAKVFKHKDLKTGNLIPWKEINNYYPFTEGLVPNTKEYKKALRLFDDPGEYPIFPFYTANQADKAEAASQGHPGTNNFSQINSTVNFRLFGSAIRHYPSKYITSQKYKKLLYWNAWSQYIDGNNKYPDSNEFWNSWNPDKKKIEYRSWIHHTMLGSSNWTIIEDVAGLRPQTDDNVELWPIDIGWDHFTVNNLNYHGDDLTIVWDKPDDGETYYGEDVPEGYSVYINGERTFTVDSLVHLKWDSATGEVTFPDENGEVIYNKQLNVNDAQEVDLKENTGGDRVADMFQKAGVDLSKNGDQLNLASSENVTVKASHTADDTSISAAVNGYTINQPFWGSKGSGNDQDWYQIDFGEEKAFDNVKLYFYNNINNDPPDDYDAPSMYSVQYYDGTKWVDVPGQYKSPNTPRANYNQVQFPEIQAQKIRVLMTHRSGYHTGLKEVQVFDTGVQAPEAINAAPNVSASQSGSKPLKAQLQGAVRDDALPNGTLTATWSKMNGPGSAIFKDAHAANTEVTFTKAGTYTLKLTANDGEKSSNAEISVSVEPMSEALNVAGSAEPSASHTSPWESLQAINDGIEPIRSGDGTGNPKYGNWPETGTQWVQLTWDQPVTIDKSDVYFFDDGGGVRVPASWKIQYWDGDTFKDVKNPSEYKTEIDQYNTVSFDAVKTKKLRLKMESGKGSTGIKEWKTYALPPEKIRPIHVPTLVDEQPDLPSQVQLINKNGSRSNADVAWEPIDEDQLQKPGSHFSIEGIVSGTKLRAEATIYVRKTGNVNITNIADTEVKTRAGIAPALPSTVKAIYNDGSVDNVNTSVTWEEINPPQYAHTGTFTVKGDVKGTDLKATTKVTVVGEGMPSIHIDKPESLSVSSKKDVDVSGSVEDDSAIDSLSVNGNDVELSKEDSSYTFNTPIHFDSDGLKTLTFKAVDDEGNESTLERKVIVDTTAPTLEVEAPATTTKNKATLKFHFADNYDQLRLTVNEEKVYNREGEDNEESDFSKDVDYEVTLGDGKNAFNLELTDIAGHVTKKKVTVTKRDAVKNVSDMKKVVQNYKDEGAFQHDSNARKVTLQLTTIGLFEQSKSDKKVIKHLKGLRILLDYQHKNQLISDEAYDVLKDDTKHLLNKWQK